MSIFDTLNDDVLQYLLSYITPRDALRVMQTSHDGYHYALPRFLSEVVLGATYEHGSSQVESFCSYMQADMPQRIPYLRSLTLLDTGFMRHDTTIRAPSVALYHDYSPAEVLAEVLRYATQLRHICVVQPDMIFAAVPCFMDALESLPRLNKIEFILASSRSLLCLSRLTSHPQEIRLQMAQRWHPRARDLQANLVAILHLADSLRRLHLRFSVNLSRGLTPEAVWPFVQELSLEGSVALEMLLPAFPNLRSIHFGNCEFTRGSLTFMEWPHQVDEVTALSPAPITRPVRRLSLRYNIAVQPSTLELLESTSPTVLSCFVGWGELDHRIGQSVPNLKFLELHVKWNNIGQGRRQEGEPHFWLLTYVALFAEAPLIGLALHIGAGVIGVSEIDSMKLAMAIVTEMRSLQFVALSIDNILRRGLNDEEPKYTWYRRESGTHLRELSEWEGEDTEQRLRNIGSR